MKEINDIIASYAVAQQSGQSCALATVVHVEGSSYRRPGARMLVTDEGRLTGAISGGCLEGDVLRKALLTINEGTNKLVTYDTTEDDSKLGVQLGCNGIVHILFEPIIAHIENNPLVLLKKAMQKRGNAVVSTLFSLMNKDSQPGTCFLYAEDGNIEVAGNEPTQTEELTATIKQGALQCLEQEQSNIVAYDVEGLHVFHQFIPLPVRLIIGGAGNDAIPLVNIATLLGWEVTLIDGRKNQANATRFPGISNIVVSKPEAFLEQVMVDKNTCCVLMSHNYNYDLGMLKKLLNTSTRYIGILGPKTKMDRMYDDLEKEGISVTNRNHIYSPVGLDIGVETAEEIALSIAAEIKAVLMKKEARMLREKDKPVHA